MCHRERHLLDAGHTHTPAGMAAADEGLLRAVYPNGNGIEFELFRAENSMSAPQTHFTFSCNELQSNAVSSESLPSSGGLTDLNLQLITPSPVFSDCLWHRASSPFILFFSSFFPPLSFFFVWDYFQPRTNPLTRCFFVCFFKLWKRNSAWLIYGFFFFLKRVLDNSATQTTKS